MKTVYGAHYCSLHVRVSNRPAITLYKDVLGYENMGVEEHYYADQEDAYDMKLFFNQETRAKMIEKKNPVKEEESKEKVKLEVYDTAEEPAVGAKKKKKNKKKKN